jgi:hypothetical protein
MSVPLASVDDLAVYLGRTFTGAEEAQATLMLDLASGAIRSYTRQTLSREQTIAYLEAGCCDYLELPERPVVSVDDMEFDGVPVAASGYQLVGNRIWWGPWPINFSLNPRFAPESVVTVEYTHGFDPVPDDIRGVCLAMAARAVETLTGVKSETIGGYSVTYAGADGGVALVEGEKQTLNRYRRRTFQ